MKGPKLKKRVFSANLLNLIKYLGVRHIDYPYSGPPLGCLEANTLAYFAEGSVTKGKKVLGI
jgi:hypothetical protein